ncbi:hypothetical protein ILUMI_19641, partial [Ignelater luminosus]
VYADGYVPHEVEFMVVNDHPTLLNVTLHTAKRKDGVYYRPQQPPYHHHHHHGPTIIAQNQRNGIFSSISNGFNNFVSSIFG